LEDRAVELLDELDVELRVDLPAGAADVAELLADDVLDDVLLKAADALARSRAPASADILMATAYI
jgi:hypothetical protein